MDGVFVCSGQKLLQHIGIHDEFGDVAQGEEVLLVVVQEQHKEDIDRFVVRSVKSESMTVLVTPS